jgi:predicted phosphodiesterase
MRQGQAQTDGALLKTLILPDLHLGSHDDSALRVALKVAEDYRPEEVVILGDWLDAHELSAHQAGDRREALAAGYFTEVGHCREVLEFFEALASVRRVTFIEGNHEYRVERWATATGGFAESVVDRVSPRTLLSEGRRAKFRWVPYKAEDTPSHVEIAPGLIACHGWSTAKHAAAAHLGRALGLSVVHGHTHRRQTYVLRHPVTGRQIEGHSPGCLSKLQPLWVSGPTDWSQGVTLLNTVRDRWTLTAVPIEQGTAILPDGRSITAGRKGSVLRGVA